MDFINDSDHLDQHFLIDDKVLNKFVDSADIDSNDIVVEIGPGNGAITKIIASKAKKLYCIELDKRLKHYLDDICKINSNVEIIYDNALTVDIPPCDKIISALPYSIIEPFMSKMIRTDFKELIMITGKKYAQSVVDKEITYLSLLTNCFFYFEKIMDIEPSSFNPQPHAMSSMIKLSHKEKDSDDIFSFFKMLYLLNHKKIRNSLLETLIAKGFCCTKKEARSIITEMHFPYELLDTKFEVCSNTQLEVLYKKVEKLYNDKNRYRIG